MKFTKKRNYALTKRKFDLHFWVYFIICMIGIYLTCAMPVHASLGYYEVQDLYQTITDNVKEANDLLNKAFSSGNPSHLNGQVNGKMYWYFSLKCWL